MREQREQFPLPAPAPIASANAITSIHDSTVNSANPAASSGEPAAVSDQRRLVRLRSAGPTRARPATHGQPAEDPACVRGR